MPCNSTIGRGSQIFSLLHAFIATKNRACNMTSKHSYSKNPFPEQKQVKTVQWNKHMISNSREPTETNTESSFLPVPAAQWAATLLRERFTLTCRMKPMYAPCSLPITNMAACTIHRHMAQTCPWTTNHLSQVYNKAGTIGGRSMQLRRAPPAKQEHTLAETSCHSTWKVHHKNKNCTERKEWPFSSSALHA